VFGNAVVATAIGPATADTAHGIAEYVDAMVIYVDLPAPVLLQFLDAALRDPRPYTQYVCVVINL
jgi:hypothetical protein